MKKEWLPYINTPEDVRKIPETELPQLVREIRDYIIAVISKKGGHLGSSLGVIELTVALHYVFNTPDDVLIWDVGHQAYGHKIITGRRKLFLKNRDKNGISGFPKRAESIFDAFGVGHSSTSISAALGMALATALNGNTTKQHIAVIGDASIASGMAFEGLNHAGDTDANLLVILNDNAIGIDPSVGALKKYFTTIKQNTKTNQTNIVKALNFNYSGPINGHNLPLLIKELNRLKNIKGPKFLHVVTTKGKGLPLAEKEQVKYHSPGKFEAKTGEIYTEKQENLPPKYQDVFGHTLVELATKNTKIVGITPAMPTGSSLKYMMDKFPNRAFDVGIAEQHAVTLAAGMATQGKIVFCTIYSTFLQRAYDQIIHDVALQKLPVVFCIDRAGLVGNDGATHQGVFDIAYLACIPNIIITAPLNEIELRNCMYTAQQQLSQPISIRYPRGRAENNNWQQPFTTVTIGKAKQVSKGNKIAILSTGTIGNNVIKALEKVTYKKAFSHYHFLTILPLDKEKIKQIAMQYKSIITVEDGIITGGFGSLVTNYVMENNYMIPVKKRGVSNGFLEQATILEQQKESGIDIAGLTTFFNEEELAVQ